MPGASANHSLSRIRELDGLRGIAILSVLIYHFFWFPSPGWNWDGIAHGAWKVAQVGWIGVHIFFVLSGFLITRILINQKNQPNYFYKFYSRRIVRIFPLYLLTLFFVYFYFPDSGRFVLLSLLFLAHAAPLLQIPNSYPVLWSLSIEEQFYFFWPWLVKHLSSKKLLVLCFALLCFSPLLRGARFLMKEKADWLTLVTSFDGFAIGALLALGVVRAWSKTGVLTLILLCGLLPWGIYTRTSLVGEMFLPTVLYLFTATVMIICISHGGSPYLGWLRSGALPKWGKVSYGAYLSHHAVFIGVDWLYQMLQIDSAIFKSSSYCFLQAVILIATTYGISHFLFYFIEEPLLQWNQQVKPDLLATQNRNSSSL